MQQPSKRVLGLRLITPCLGPSGYADEGRTLLRELATRQGIQLTLSPMRFGPAKSPEDLEDLIVIKTTSSRAPSTPFAAIHLVAPTLVHFDGEPTAQVNVIRTMFETDGLPPAWLEPLRRADEVWVPTEANRKSFAAAGVPAEAIHVIPEPLDPERYDPEKTAPDPQVRGDGKRFVFLSVFDWSFRKAPELLLRAFADEFKPGEAELVLKVHCSGGASYKSLTQTAARIVSRARGGGPGPGVRFLAPFRSSKAMPSLYRGADAFVLATRGEGWGRTIHEAMAMALPVIATCGGATETLVGPRGVAYPVSATLVPVPPPALKQAPLFAGQNWWEPSFSNLRARMREVFEDRTRARETGARAREHVKRFTPRKVVDMMLARAGTLMSRSPVGAGSSRS